MSDKVPEPRTAVMIMVDVSWEDRRGTVRRCPACIVNRSKGGACIRLRHPIPAGTQLRVQWRWERFTGVTRYCRSDGRDYLVDIQKDAEPKTIGNASEQARQDEKNSRETVAASVRRLESAQESTRTEAVAKIAAEYRPAIGDFGPIAPAQTNEAIPVNAMMVDSPAPMRLEESPPLRESVERVRPRGKMAVRKGNLCEGNGSSWDKGIRNRTAP